MLALQRAIPDIDILLSLTPEELGGKIIFLLRNIPKNENSGNFHAGSFSLEFDPKEHLGIPGYPPIKVALAKQAFFEAWSWLESQALIIWANDYEGTQGWRRLSRRAEAFKDEGQFLAFTTGKELRPEMLHPSIAKDVWLDFARQKYDVAIFQAMKAVEIAVRSKSGAAEKDYGVSLMRSAFHIENGPLTDSSEPVAEREALLALFAGSIGRFKNPQSHRNVGVRDARDAIEVILLANHLLKILDSRPVPLP